MNASARCPGRSSCPDLRAPTMPNWSWRSAADDWPLTRSLCEWSRSTGCPATRWARCCGPRCWTTTRPTRARTMGGDLLEGRRILVVGASAGIGRAFAVSAVRGGAKVVLTARRMTELRSAADEAGGGTAVAGDIADDASRRTVLGAAVDALGQIDLVLCTVGVATLGYAKDADAHTWEQTFRTNVVALNQLIRDL